MGVYLKHDVGGDSPNANYFRNTRVYSHGQEMSNEKIGFNVDSGRYGCSFVDCEANLHPGATACIRFGDVTGQNYVINFTAECLGGAHGIWMDTGAGAGDDGFMNFINYFHATAGSSIFSTEGSSVKRYNAWSAGFPDRFTSADRPALPMLFSSRSISTAAFTMSAPPQTPRRPTTPWCSFFPRTAALSLRPARAGRCDWPFPDRQKLDISENVITIRRLDDTNSGPDNTNFRLVRENDWVVLYCNGSEWSIIATNRVKLQSKFYDTSVTGTSITIDADIYFHLISPLANTTVTPSPSAAASLGKSVCIKRNSAGGTTLKVNTVEGGYTIDLNLQNDYITVFCNGADWFITSERRDF